MLLLLLIALAGVCATQAAQLLVIINYEKPNVTLSIPGFDKGDITQMVFHLGVGGTEIGGKGVQTSDGWEFKTQVGEKPGNMYAYADIHFSSGFIITTIRSYHNGEGRSLDEVLPGGRRLRAIIFRDDFNSFSFNRVDWLPEVSMFGGRNWEFQVYTNDPKNLYSKDGKLFLDPTLTVDDPRFDENFLKTGVMDIPELFGYCTNTADYGCNRDGHNGMLPPIMSGKVSSVAAIKFGTVEVRAKIPRGDWLWPAIWMMPKKSVYGTWPRSGEMDIMESRGNAGELGVGTVSSTLHWGPQWNINKWDLTHGEKKATSWANDFHTWKLEWSVDHIRTTVDNQEILSVVAGDGFWKKGGFTGDNIWASGSKMAPFDQEFYLILNVAVGGTNGYFSDTANWGVRKPWPNNSPHANLDFWNARNDWLPTWQGDNAAMQVDYVQLSN